MAHLSRYKATNIALTATLLVLMYLCLALGPVPLTGGALSRALFQGAAAPDDTEAYIVQAARLPRMWAALLAGAGLSLCGLLMQTLFRNPLASPSILGISGGASLGVALLIMAGSAWGWGWMHSTAAVATSAMVGAFAVLATVLAVARRLREPATLLIFGIMLGQLAGAVESILQFHTSDTALRSFVLWGMGNFGEARGVDLWCMAAAIIPAIALAFLWRHPLNILLLGDEHATAIGLNVRRMRIGIIAITGAVAGMITAFCGPIAFIGLSVPHIARNLHRTADHRMLVVPVLLLGACTALSCDLTSRLLNVPLNAVTAAFGAPVILFLLLKKSDSKFLSA